jgi:hypothetical protein
MMGRSLRFLHQEKLKYFSMYRHLVMRGHESKEERELELEGAWW